MRKAALLISFPLLASCGAAAAWNSTCTQIFTTVCTHQQDCAIESDHATCVEQMHSQWYCDPSASLEDLKICKEEAPNAGCGQSMAEPCYAVLCDQTIGCIETNIDTNNPEGTPDP